MLGQVIWLGMGTAEQPLDVTGVERASAMPPAVVTDHLRYVIVQDEAAEPVVDQKPHGPDDVHFAIVHKRLNETVSEALDVAEVDAEHFPGSGEVL